MYEYSKHIYLLLTRAITEHWTTLFIYTMKLVTNPLYTSQDALTLSKAFLRVHPAFNQRQLITNFVVIYLIFLFCQISWVNDTTERYVFANLSTFKTRTSFDRFFAIKGNNFMLGHHLVSYILANFKTNAANMKFLVRNIWLQWTILSMSSFIGNCCDGNDRRRNGRSVGPQEELTGGEVPIQTTSIPISIPIPTDPTNSTDPIGWQRYLSGLYSHQHSAPNPRQDYPRRGRPGHSGLSCRRSHSVLDQT